MDKFKGTGVAMVTPFNVLGAVDYEALEHLVNYLSEGEVEYLVVLGTTGETATLTAEEKAKVLERVQSVNHKKLPIVLGMGGNNTAALVSSIKNADLSGVDAILSASPHYNKPTQEGIYQHYKAVSEATDKPIILYNVPGRTASNISAETTLRLAHDFDNIIGVKEASADMDQVMAIIQGKPQGFLVISGEDGLTFPIIASGGKGVISVVANAYPKIFSDMVRATLSGDLERGRENHYHLKKFIDLLFAEGNPGGIKAALQILGICEDHLRLPLWKISDALQAKLKTEMERIG